METSSSPICGLWIDDEGLAHVSVAKADGSREERVETLRPFTWFSEPPADVSVAGVETEQLKGEGVYSHLAHAETLAAHENFYALLKTAGVSADTIRPLENAFLLQRRERLFRELSFAQVRRCQFDIETGSSEEGRFSDASKAGDRVLAIGLQFGARQRLLVLEAMTDEAEKKLLLEFNAVLLAEDPDVIEGHNLFKFDFDYLRQRAKRLKVACAWGRFGQKATFRNSRLKVAERWVDFPRCDLPGRTVIDTYLLVQMYDITTREMTSYGLKDVAVYFGITSEDAAESGGRTYLAGDKIHAAFQQDREAFLAYLADDLRETKGIADLLLPTYFEQTKTFPILLQDATLRGTTAKIDLLFLEEYYHARQACPSPAEVAPFEGGYTRSFKEGVFKHVLHFDVASLYPSLLLQIARNPRNDSLGVFIPLLSRLREYRLKFKQLARTAETEELRAEYQARQTNFKILINSFYGYLGFANARFGDGELAAEVTRRGRELLQALIDEFARHGCTILEADTDGIYLSSEEFFDRPEELLAKVEAVLPKGIELEYDGRYTAMFCYKAKNYALYDGTKLTIRGSALRSRGIEPYLKKISDRLIRFLVGAETESPLVLVEDFRRRIAERSASVAELAKSEVLSSNPDAYERAMNEGGKPRRASAEAALQLTPRPRMGERVAYYITAKAKGKTSDWQRAKPVALYDAANAPYDPQYYLDKLDDWIERYGVFLGVSAPKEQGEFSLE
ncbi:DNA polymerase [Nibricoccus aquaticus]|uniref:DNA-directed DNA polymerase n=1 Tax=Nibricoccus aquaticus TaxID=2576891 RepID=A0A290QL83_9BACT|nr:DNA polymerase domain-containing protein [Nibricoccus aquaticus]ATC66178.1 DNA polymerase [Nibricoccus aquaticus]